jgi:hypothetical protein
VKAVATEVILTIGVLVAIGVAVFQLKGIYVVQQQLAGEEVVSTFAKDLESIVDKAIATTGDAAFVYYPSIKQYRVEIKNNIVSVLDKISGKTASFFKSNPQIVENQFEDCEKIFVLRQKEKIALMCKCLELGDSCTDSMICCSGYCDDLSKKCDLPPTCPQDWMKCPDAPTVNVAGGNAWIDANGVVCCPLTDTEDFGRFCSNKHCCPEHKPNWCDKPVTGDPRCMSDQDYNDPNVCKKNVLTLMIIPIQWNDLSKFKQIAEKNADWWSSLLPCNVNLNKIIIDTRNCQSVSSVGILQCARNWGLIPATDPKGYDWRLVGLSDDWDAGSGIGGFVDCTGDLDDPLCKVSWVTTAWGKMQGREDKTPPFPHELGHTFGLCGEYCGPGNCDGPVYHCSDTRKCPEHCSEINKRFPYPVDQNCVMNNKAAIYYHDNNHCEDWLLNKGLPNPIKFYC